MPTATTSGLLALVLLLALLLAPARGWAAPGAPAIEWSPTTSTGAYDFGTIAPPTTRTFTVKNSGTVATGALTVTLFPVSGLATAFSKTSDTCTMSSLRPTKTCTITVTYSGSSASAKLTAASKRPAATASLTLTANDDLTPPDTAITTKPPDPSNSGTATFEFTGDDTGGSGVAGFECSLDGADFDACPSPTTYTNLTDGAHSFEVRAIDAAGNADPIPDRHDWTIDTIAPDATITTSPQGTTRSTEATFEFTTTATDVTGFQCSLDGADFDTCQSPTTYTGLAEGTHTFQVHATDDAGNTATATFEWTIDTTAPDTTITTKPQDTTRSTEATFEFTTTATDVTGFQCSLDGADFDTCQSPTTYTGLAEGTHTFQVHATDDAGNTATATFEWTIDTTAPETTITTKPQDTTRSTEATFEFTTTATDVTGFQCSLDGAGFDTCESPTAYTGLAEGTHTFQVHAIDDAGNTATATFEWTIDTTAPETTITTKPQDLSNSQTATFEFTATDTGGSAVAGLECSLDGGAFETCQSPTTYTNLTEGTHTFDVHAIDEAGNTGTATFDWTIDTAAPDTTITTKPRNPTLSHTATFAFTGDDAGGSGVASFQCSLDGADFGACASPRIYANLTDGAHTFLVRAIDEAGNADTSPDRHDWTIERLQISAGGTSTCALTNTGAVKCWGDNRGGQLGSGGTYDSSDVPVDVSGLDGQTAAATAISAGGDHTCALTSTATVKCWGLNGIGQLGTGSTLNNNSTTPVGVTGLDGDTVTAISAGWSHTCALTSAGTVKCWGFNGGGQLGSGTAGGYSSVPVAVSGLAGETVTAIAVGTDHACALTRAGAVKCWGHNGYGQLGTGSIGGTSSAPVAVSGLAGVSVIAITAGSLHTCAMTSTGAVKCWGQNQSGQLGDGTQFGSGAPRDVLGLEGETVTAITGGGGHTCALTSAGAAKCWGRNVSGQLGIGTTGGFSTVPVDVSGLGANPVAAIAITAGLGHTCALTSEGAAKCWGENEFGQLGAGSTGGNSGVPVDVSGLEGDPPV